jgi:hypothetical protein
MHHDSLHCNHWPQPDMSSAPCSKIQGGISSHATQRHCSVLVDSSNRYGCGCRGSQVTQVPLPVNITSSSGTVTYVTLSAVNTTGKPGNLTVLQVRPRPVCRSHALRSKACEAPPAQTSHTLTPLMLYASHLVFVCTEAAALIASRDLLRLCRRRRWRPATRPSSPSSPSRTSSTLSA